jgi:hypothetical protein
MQMYLWTGKGDHQVVVNNGTAAGTYRAQGASFGAALDPTGITGDIVLVNDGTAPPPTPARPSPPIVSLGKSLSLTAAHAPSS